MNAVVNALKILISFFLNLPSDPIGSFLSEHLDKFDIIQDKLDVINYFVPLNIMFPVFLSWLSILPGIVLVMIVIKFFL